MINQFVVFFICLFMASVSTASANADSSIKEGDKLYAEGSVKEALPFYEKAVKENPDSAQNWFKLARTQMLNSQNADSVKSYQKSISLDSNNSLAFIGMAIAYLHIGKYKHARASLTEATRIDPTKKAEVEKVLAQIDDKLQSMDKATANNAHKMMH